MNRTDILNSTGSVLVHLKAYNNKLCRKGLLERGLNMKISIGNFVNLENAFIRDSFNQNVNKNDLLAEFKEKTTKEMESEAKTLYLQLEAINNNNLGMNRL